LRKSKLNKFAVNHLFADGVATRAKLFIVRAVKNDLPYSRFAAIAPRKTGNAVCRNLLKRRLRAAWTARRENLPGGFDVAIIARREVATVAFPVLLEMFAQSVKAAMDTAFTTPASASQGPQHKGESL